MEWNIIHGNRARQPRSSSPKRRELALLVLKTKLFFFLIQVFFWYNKAFVCPLFGGFDEILHSMMIFPSGCALQKYHHFG